MSKITQKREEAAREAKEKKQKKILIFLAPVLLLVLVWQGPGMLKAFTGGGEATTTAAGATTLVSTAPTDPTGAAPTTAGGDPAAVPTPGGSAPLPESDETVVAAEGQLLRFDRFLGKDPFNQQVKANEALPPPTDPGTTGGSVTPVPNDPGTDQPSAYTSATLEVNGVDEQLSKGTAFPASDPLFRLVAITGKNVKIGLVSGSFSDGQDTVTVKVGKTVTLVSQPDGIRYVIKLVSVAKAP